MRMGRLVATFLLAVLPAPILACTGAVAICDQGSDGALALIGAAGVATVIADAGDNPAVRRAAADLQSDIARVAGRDVRRADMAVIVGTLGHSPIIDRLAREGRLDTKGLAGHWEAYAQQVVERPAPGIARALVIVGADRRGAIYGAYDISARIGVSPWNWWADVPVARHDALYVTPGARSDAPAVKYRGIFLNDEDPSLKGWVDATYGGFNHKFYGRLFELILRLKGNFLWPAMWGKAFYDDDPENAATADAYGVVIGTSHHEPLMRAHVEWERHGKGPWDYTKNAETLRAFWRQGMERAKDTERVVTVGMRGDGDEPMTQGTAIPLLERIVRDQRAIITDVTGKPASETPQVWALYKEVQDYYDQGMQVPPDVTLLFSDDNWGNIRRLPRPGDRRPGGYGVYYHFDYVGGPRNYKWINTTQIARVWEQMKRARAYGADRLWIVNVGDLKPMELPTSFFLDLAWNPEAMTLDRLAAYHRDWAEQQFGAEHAAEIADYLDRTTRLLARRKPELIDPQTWSLSRDREAIRVIADYDRLQSEATATAARLPPAAHDAYYQLVLHPIEAAANLNRLYVTVARNRLHAAQGRADANALADEAARLFAEDRAIAARYEGLGGGKWVHMMDQTHIGYTMWQQPPADVMPAVARVTPPAGPAMGVAEEGATAFWQPGGTVPALRPFDRYGRQDRVIEVFSRGTTPYRFRARADAPWLRLDRREGAVSGTTPLRLTVDWTRVPAGTATAHLTIEGPKGQSLSIPVSAANAAPATGYVEGDGRIVIEAAHHAGTTDAAGLRWSEIPGLGRTLSAMTPLPAGTASVQPGAGPSLDYEVTLRSGGSIFLDILASPSLDVLGGGLRYAVAIDDEAPQVIDLLADTSQKAWEESVIASVRIGRSRHVVAGPGRHRVRIWMVDPGLVVQRLILSREAEPAMALGPEESPKQ